MRMENTSSEHPPSPEPCRSLAARTALRENRVVRPSSTELIRHLKAVCSSETFAGSPLCKKLLRYLIDSVVQQRGPGNFKGAIIGVEVFGLPPNHDPRRHSNVRVTFGQLRDTLQKYYGTDGKDEPVRIRIPVGSYVPEASYDPDFASLALDATSIMHAASAKALMNRRTLSGYREAFRYLGMALENHPHHPRLLALMAMAHAASAMYGQHPRTAFEAATTYVDRARQSARETWELPLVDAWITMNLRLDWRTAEQLFDRAIELSGAEARHHTWYTAFLASQLRWGEFLSLVEDAASGPHYDCAYSRGRLAFAQIVAGRLDAAEATLKQTFELFPQVHYTTHLHLGLLREARGDFTGAAEAITEVPFTAQDTTIGLGLKALLLGLAGQRGTARKLYQELVALRASKKVFVPAAQLGYACLGTGDLDRAITWLTEGYVDECDPLSSWAAILPATRHLRGHREFKVLIESRLKLRFSDANPSAPATA